MKLESLIQGVVVNVQGNEYSVRTREQQNRNFLATPNTVTNGWPKIGDHALIVINDVNQALVITRYCHSQFKAA